MRMIEADTLLAVRAGRLFDGDRGLEPSTVLIDDGRIVDVNTTGAAPPVHADVLDLGHDVCLLPGLIDAHAHLALTRAPMSWAGSPPLTTRSCWTRWRGPHVRRRRRALRPYGTGITTVRDLGDRNFLALRLRDQLDASAHPGPHIVASGPPITIRAGHCDFLGGVANGVRALRAAVRERTMIEP